MLCDSMGSDFYPFAFTFTVAGSLQNFVNVARLNYLFRSEFSVSDSERALREILLDCAMQGVTASAFKG